MKYYSRLLAFALIALLTAVGLMFLASPVDAQHSGTVKYCGSIAEGTFPYADGTKITLNQWNKTALGIPNATLNSVTVTATMWVTQSFSAKNTQPTSGYVRGKTDVEMLIASPNENPLPDNYLFSLYAFRSIVSQTLQAAGEPGDTYDWGTGTYTHNGSQLDTPVAPYIGSGTVDFPIGGYANFVNQGNLGNLQTNLTTTARAEICVIYSYSNPTAVTLSSMSAETNTVDAVTWFAAGLLLVGILGVAGWRMFR